VKAFADGIEEQDIRISLLIGGEKTANEALGQALELQAVFLAASPTRQAPRHSRGAARPPPGEGTRENQHAGTVENRDTSWVTATTKKKADKDRRRKQEERPIRDMRKSPRRSEWRPNNNEVTNRRGGQPSGNERGPAERAGRRRIQ
jgi:hypothetical protein